MMVNGKIIKKKEKEYFIIKVEINMMVNGKMINMKEIVIYSNFNILFK